MKTTYLLCMRFFFLFLNNLRNESSYENDSIGIFLQHFLSVQRTKVLMYTNQYTKSYRVKKEPLSCTSSVHSSLCIPSSNDNLPGLLTIPVLFTIRFLTFFGGGWGGHLEKQIHPYVPFGQSLYLNYGRM